MNFVSLLFVTIVTLNCIQNVGNSRMLCNIPGIWKLSQNFFRYQQDDDGVHNLPFWFKIRAGLGNDIETLESHFLYINLVLIVF